MLTGQMAVFSNREDWEFPVMDIIDDDTGDVIDLSAATLTYGIYDESGCQILTGATGDGTITLADDDAFQIVIPRSSITDNCSGTYKMGITVENADITKSLLAGSISVVNGNVPI